MSDNKMKALEIGPGKNPVDLSWDMVDVDYRRIKGHTGTFYMATWGEYAIPVNENTYDLVYSSHTLEHVPWYRVEHALKEVFRILRGGGEFEVWVPNARYIFECWLSGKCGDDWRRHNKEGDPWKWASGRMFTYGPGLDSPNWHRSMFDEKSLSLLLYGAGFSMVERLPKRTRGKGHGPIDLGVRARKAG